MIIRDCTIQDYENDRELNIRTNCAHVEIKCDGKTIYKRGSPSDNSGTGKPWMDASHNEIFKALEALQKALIAATMSAPKVSPDGTIVSGHARIRNR